MFQTEVLTPRLLPERQPAQEQDDGDVHRKGGNQLGRQTPVCHHILLRTQT